MTASARDATTASVSAAASNTSHTTGSAPTASSWVTLSRERVMPATTWPSSTSSGNSRTPITPVAPARKIRIAMARITLRGGLEVDDPLEAALRFAVAYPGYDSQVAAVNVFDERDLRLANRGGARISAAEQAAILERRGQIERALRRIRCDASLLDESIPWAALTPLFGGFGDIRGVGFSKMTKALHRKRPALIPILDSVVVGYLAHDDPPESFAEHATALVRRYKEDLDRNGSALRSIRRELAARGHELTEVRILDILTWSAFA